MRLAAVGALLLALAGLAAGILIGSALRGVDNPWLGKADQVAVDHGWQGGRVDGGPFQLAAFRRFDDTDDGMLTVYIEGDGLAWITPTELSTDPTPRSPRVLELAVQDPAANVAYLARPCQYLPADELARCAVPLWSVSRYTGLVVLALDEAIETLMHEAGASRLRLVGVSGGGTLAVLVAARRDDVAALVTVAANLDHEVWSARHGTTRLIDSLNAADVAAVVEHIPQVHFVGAEDDIVTLAEIDAFVARMNDSSRVEVVVVPEFNHVCCWAEVWPALLAEHSTATDD